MLHVDLGKTIRIVWDVKLRLINLTGCTLSRGMLAIPEIRQKMYIRTLFVIAPAYDRAGSADGLINIFLRSKAWLWWPAQVASQETSIWKNYNLPCSTSSTSTRAGSWFFPAQVHPLRANSCPIYQLHVPANDKKFSKSIASLFVLLTVLINIRFLEKEMGYTPAIFDAVLSENA